MKFKILQLSFLALLVSCIHNDVPYPHIKGEVTAFEVEGQVSVSINPETQQINLVMGEEVDIRTAKITKFEINEEGKASFVPGTSTDLTNPIEFIIKVYKDWDWKIVTTQPIERRINVKNQVGAARIDFEAKTAQIDVSALTQLNNIEINSLKLGPPAAIYTPDPMTITDFSEPVTLEVEYWGKKETWTLTAQNVTATVITLEPTEVWGGFAKVEGSIVEGSSDTPVFRYRAKGSEEPWLTAPAIITDATAISTRIIGLQGNTTYEYFAQLGKEDGAIKEFTTEATPLIPNMNLDTWTKSGKAWYPNDEAKNIFWASGNEGVNYVLAGSKESNSFPTEDAVSGLAACISTIKVNWVGLAAGNLYTGDFKLVITSATQSAKFSRNYYGRPTKLSFQYKYLPKLVDVAKTAEVDSIGKADHCHIYMYLGDWENEASTFSTDLKQELTENVIAFGEFRSNKEVDTYTRHTIDLQYFDRVRKPTKIIIVATSSIMGEKYCGGVGSTLFLDDLEFSFD